ncbi:MAG: DUF1302 domain-containing protein [Dehalococcoidia bacterium]
MDKGKTSKKWMYGFQYIRVVLIATVVLLMGICNTAVAFEIPTGSEDIGLRWDNTFRYNYGVRLRNPADRLLLVSNSDDGDRNFGEAGETVTNRLDILSELDLTYKRDYGVRFSGAFWYDQRYNDPMGNTSVATSNHFENGQQALGLGDVTKRLYCGPDGELLDAFVFGKFNLGPVPVNIKVGRHTLFWGESMLLTGAINGISYSQMPIDAAKAYATPGAEAKELFRPLFNISASAQLTNTLSLSAQQFWEWEPYRIPETGSYLGFSDVYLGGGEALIAGPGVFFTHASDVEPDGKKDWGVAAQWSPEWLGGKMGLYYRKFSDKLPQMHVDAANRRYYFAYGEGIDLYGVSFSKEIMTVSIGLEYSLRHNMPLVSSITLTTPVPPPAEGETFGARGDTQHAVLNLLGVISRTPLFDTASWLAECTYHRWDKVTQGMQYFKGRDGYEALDRVSRDAMGAAISFTPTWYQVFPGMDLSMPLYYSRGLFGNSALLFLDNKNGGSMSAKLVLDVFQKYNFTLGFAKYYGDYDTNAAGAITAARGSMPYLGDRDWLSFTFKFTL